MIQNEEVVIEHDIPIPPAFHPGRSQSELSKKIGAMEIGDSIFFQCTPQNVRPMAYRHIGKKFTVRKVENGTRIWRIE